jgi:two-component system, OmpR family, sensor kinase
MRRLVGAVRSPGGRAILSALPFVLIGALVWRSDYVLHSYAPFSTVLVALGVVVGVVVLAVGLVNQGQRRALAAAKLAAETNAQRQRRQLLGRIDHEIKNPLTAIRIGLANLALADDDPNSAISSVNTQVERVARLLGDLRKLSELETREIERVPVDLHALLTDVAEATKDLINDGDRTVRLTLPQAPWPLPSIPGDRDLLFLAVYNLAANAVKFTGPGEVIEIRATDEGKRVAIEVADTGMGIAADEVDAVWGELVRGREASGIVGSGLGLSFVQIVTERHQGSAQLRSRHGSGTVVRIELPTM